MAAFTVARSELETSGSRYFAVGTLIGVLSVAGCSTRFNRQRATEQGPVAKEDSTGSAATLVLTTKAEPFSRSLLHASRPEGPSDFVVDPTKTFQAMEGFVGAFNEQGWDALMTLDPVERDRVLKALFDPTSGLRFDYCRAPIGASDYAMSRYTLDEAAGDYAMTRFSIERDREKLIPYIKAAMRFRPDLRIWASAWTPPTWMKTNGGFDGGAMRDEPQVYAAYALYLATYVEKYRAEGIPIAMVVPQNEPGQLTYYPSCDWRPAQYVTFLRDHLGPLLRERHLDTKVFLGTINQETWDAMHVLADPGARSFLGGVALQWFGLPHAAKIRRVFPDLPIMQSETECGNNSWEPGFNPQRPPNDFRYAAYTWRKFRNFIAAGSSSYMLWNMVLDEHGKNLDRLVPWPQNSAVIVDRATHQITYTPMFWVARHFSGLIDPGARLVHSEGPQSDAIAFVNPNGSVLVELLNDAPASRHVAVTVGRTSYEVSLPGESFATLVVPGQARVTAP